VCIVIADSTLLSAGSTSLAKNSDGGAGAGIHGKGSSAAIQAARSWSRIYGDGDQGYPGMVAPLCVSGDGVFGAGWAMGSSDGEKYSCEILKRKRFGPPVRGVKHICDGHGPYL
jgi:hypothetical protein